MNAGADCDHFIRVHALVAFLAEQLLHDRLNARHASLSADQHHFIDLARINARVLHALPRRTNRSLQNVLNHAFELRPGQLLDQVLRPAGVRGDERQIDLRLHRGRKLDLGALSRVTQTLQCHLIALAAQIEALVFLELVNQPVNQPLINVVAAEVGVTVGSLDFNHAFADFENRNIKSPAAEVVHGDGLVLTFIESVSERGRRRLIDDSLHVEPGNLPGIFGRLPLRVVKVNRHSDERLGHLFAEIVFRRFLQLLQNQR